MGFLKMNSSRNVEEKMIRKEMTIDDHQQLEKLKHKMNLIKTALVKTPIIQDKDFT